MMVQYQLAIIQDIETNWLFFLSLKKTIDKHV